MVDVDLFGIKFSTSGKSNEFKKKRTVEYEISLKELCDKLGFDHEKVIYCHYEYPHRVLKLKVNE